MNNIVSYIAAGILMAAVFACWRRRVGEPAASFRPAAFPNEPRELLVRIVLEEGKGSLDFEPDRERGDGRAVEPDETESVERFVIDSWVVRESFRKVCGQCRRGENFVESFHYASGMRVRDTHVIAHIVPVAFAMQSAGGVRVADESNIAALAELDRIGLPLVAHFHSHPGFGRTANFPSQTDRAFQERLEAGGYVTVGGIFSRDGYLRFFAGDDRQFNVEVIGNGVETLGPNEFRLAVADGNAPREAGRVRR
ncbi:MAG: Mov34/MPN/PAD-1 family protein [Planctomycetales bacterium]